MPTPTQWAAARARMQMYRALRAEFENLGYFEVETPCLVAAPGMEPHIEPFQTDYLPQTDIGEKRRLWLHTSPEYAMKRMLADEECPPLFQICKTFRNGEISSTHNPEFTMLEFYRPHADYHAIMDDLERLLAAAETAVAPQLNLFSKRPFERLTVRDAVKRHTGIDLFEHLEGSSLARAARDAEIHIGDSTSFDDVFFHIFLERVENRLGFERPCFLIEYPASMASLSRLKEGDPRVAERVELYAQGIELANGFSELCDAAEQRRRLEEEQEFRRSQHRPVYPLDERFLDAVGHMPPSGGIAVGLDRVLMLLMGAQTLAEVLLFPAKDFF